uniref:LMBR1 domain-containing protein 2 n=1 Tax=Panagrellus redivivus TaxID=6233 RepID=A0A7E4ZU73_PANRE
MQSYSNAGEFTAIGRLKAAWFNNAVYYFTYLVIFFFLLAYAISKGISLNYDHLKVIIVSASNTWGLFLLTVLLGYGLVEVPRQLWQISNKGSRLEKTYFDVDRLSAEKNDAEETLREVYMEAREVLNVLQNHRGDARGKAQQILAKIPNDIAQELSSSNSTHNFGAASNIRETDVGIVSSDRYLIRLHKRVIDAVQNYQRTLAQWRSTTELAMYLEDCDQSEITGKLSHSLLANPALRIPERIQFVWHCIAQRRIAQAFSWLFAGMTLLIMWSECTFFIVHPQLSLAARILRAAALGYHYKYIQILAIGLVSYLSICAYYTVFKLRIYRYYHLDANHLTDENSLLFSAMLLCRLTPPICLNFLGMIHLDSHITADSAFGVETQFTALMGHLDVIPLIARGINIYLPILIVLLCLGTWFRLGTRFLHSLGIDQFMTDDAMTTEMASGGKRLVAMERNRATRQRNRDERNATFAKRFNEPSTRSTGGGFSLPRSRLDDDRVPILGDVESNEHESLYAPPNQASQGLLSNDDLDFSFASEGAFQPSQLTLAGAARASSQQHSTTHPTSSSFFDDL